MCNINVLIKPQGLDVSGTLNLLTAPSFCENDNMEGVYFSSSDKIVHSLNKIDFDAHREDVTNSACVIAHERLSTSGQGLENCHPFSDDRWVMVHNGIITWKEDYGTRSDTAICFQKLVGHLKTCDVKTAIEKTFKEAVDGWWSIVLFDKLTRQCYYWKNNRPKITIAKLENGVMMIATNDVSRMLVCIKTEYDIKNNMLYMVNKNEVLKCGKLKIPKPSVIHTPKYIGYGGWHNEVYGSRGGIRNEDYMMGY